MPANNTSSTQRDRLMAVVARQSSLYGQIDNVEWFRRHRESNILLARTSVTRSTCAMYVSLARHCNRQLLAEIRKEQARGVIECGQQVAA